MICIPVSRYVALSANGEPSGQAKAIEMPGGALGAVDASAPVFGPVFALAGAGPTAPLPGTRNATSITSDHRTRPSRKAIVGRPQQGRQPPRGARGALASHRGNGSAAAPAHYVNS